MKFIAFLLLLLPVACFAGAVSVTWEAPTECSDGSALSNCPTTGYEIYMGASLTGTTFVKQSVTPAATDTQATLVNVAPGNRCFYMKTLMGTVTSPESNRVCVNVPAPGPKSPKITTIVVITPP